MVKHFLRDDDLSPAQQREVLQLAVELRNNRFQSQPLTGPQAVAVILDKPTLRTQVSFATGIAELGGYPLLVDGKLAQIGVRESIADTTRVLDRQVAAIVWRTYGQERIDEMAGLSRVPVINALTDQFHPCQILADLAAVADLRGGVDQLPGLTLTYVGDGANNMAHSYLLGGVTAGLHVRICAPEGYSPQDDVVQKAEEIAAQTDGSVLVTSDLAAAAAGADVLATDTWVSMGMDDEDGQRQQVFGPYQLNAAVLGLAKSDAQVLHCLPAYRGKEVSAEVLDGPQSIIWDEAEYRLHAQKALITWLLEQA